MQQTLKVEINKESYILTLNSFSTFVSL